MWNDLYKTALLGTNRMTPSVSTLEKLREIGIETDDATEAVLLGVGMLGLAQKAGFPLSNFEGALPTPCPVETKNYMSQKAAQYVKDILDKKMPVFTYLHPIFLNLVAECAIQNNKIVPTHILPKLLDAAGQAAVLQLSGERGIWLASQNPEWKNVFLKHNKPTKMSAAETSATNLLRGMPLTATPHLYNQAFDIVRKIGLIEDNAARVALFWVTVMEEMGK